MNGILRPVNVAAALAAAVLFAGCMTLPEVTPYAESTAALAASAGTHYGDVADEVAALKAVQMPGESSAAYALRKAQIREAQKSFAATEKALNRLFAAMTDYSEKVAALAAAGESGSEAAASLKESLQGFAELAGMGGLPTGSAASAVGKGFEKIADAFTKMEAKQSLAEALEAADPGVEIVAGQFEVIYGTALTQAAGAIRNTKKLEASMEAGPAVIGFDANVRRNYDAYYRYLNGIVTDVDPEAPGSAWRGFCREPEGSCRAVNELEAVALVEARMEAIRPIVTEYDRKIEAIEKAYRQRLKAGKAVVKAVRAWAREHGKLRESLAEGTDLKAYGLKAALEELQSRLEHL